MRISSSPAARPSASAPFFTVRRSAVPEKKRQCRPIPRRRNRTQMANDRWSADELDELREAFDYNDRDKDGRIQLDEFSAMLDELEAEMSPEEVEIGFK